MTDVVVVGAGVAGLSAAAALRRAGLTVELLEAAARIGGRAFTDHPAALGGVPFDHGASWLHAAERNKLADLARAHGDPVEETFRRRLRHVLIGDRRATEAELAGYETSYARFEDVASARAAAGADCTVVEATTPLLDDPWVPTVATWEATLIAAADPDKLSVQDWRLNELTGTNLRVPGGLGALVARRLAPLAGPVRLSTPVSRIEWDRAGGGVAVATPQGTLEARGCIVTVSTGVLASGAIRFVPELPAARQDAIAALPMGLLSKVALHLPQPERLGLDEGTSLYRRVPALGAPAMMFGYGLSGPYLLGFIGASAAWELSGPGAMEAYARDEVRALLGAEAARSLGGAVATGWGTDPLHLGAYAYAGPGNVAARAAMDTPLGPLAFAGEAWCSDGLAGTVGGAFLSGERAAAYFMAAGGGASGPIIG